MGFRLERSVYTLVFEQPEFEGLSIRVRAMSMQEALDVFDLAWLPDDTAEVRARKQRGMFQAFVDHVTEWNLEHEDGAPVPVTLDDLLNVCEPEHIGMIVGVWRRGRQKIAAPLEPPSTGSSLSEIPMTVQPSTPVPA